MSRKVTSTCKSCKSEFSYEYGGRGRYRKYCGSDCSPSSKAPVRLSLSVGCAACGEGFTPRKPWQRFCSKSCQAGNQQAMKIAQMKADGTYKYCAGCGGDMVQHPSWSFCKLPACRELAAERSRLFHNAGTRRYQAKYRAEHGLSSSQRYKDRPYNKNYRYRERHPDRAKRYDHVRRARMANCERESFSDSEIFERDGFVCGICGESVDMGLKFPDAMSASLDHIIPLSRGGGHVRANVRLAHLGCNASKSARLDDEFITAS